LALVKEYDLFVPLYDNDGTAVERQKFQALQQQLLDQFGGLAFFPQPNEGFWTGAGITYRDAIVIARVLTSDAQERSCSRRTSSSSSAMWKLYNDL
jgi:hypothetical protein